MLPPFSLRKPSPHGTPNLQPTHRDQRIRGKTGRRGRINVGGGEGETEKNDIKLAKQSPKFYDQRGAFSFVML